ncbi:MAG: hypothetical protein WCJ72_18635, partial [Chryseobacterium sp.]
MSANLGSGLETFKSYVRNSFYNMAFPHLLKQEADPGKVDELTENICNKLVQEAVKRAYSEQQKDTGESLDASEAERAVNPGKLMRMLITFIDKYQNDLPVHYNQMINDLAQNHLTKQMSPEENVASVLGSRHVAA